MHLVSAIVGFGKNDNDIGTRYEADDNEDEVFMPVLSWTRQQ